METLVAIAILAIALVVIFQLFGGGLRSGRLSEDMTRGVFHAREKMDEILLEEPLTEGVTEGEFEDGYRWEVETVYVPPQDEEEHARLPYDAYGIRVTVRWGEEPRVKDFSLETLKLVPKQEREE